MQLGHILPVFFSLTPTRVLRTRSAHTLVVASASGERETDLGSTPAAGDDSERFANTRWSFYLTLDEGGRTLFTLDMQPGGIVKFGNGGEDGTWRTRKGFMVVKQPTFLFGNDLYYSGRIVHAGKVDGEARDVVRLVDGIVDTEQSRKLVRIGAFSAHQLIVEDDEDDDYDDEEDRWTADL